MALTLLVNDHDWDEPQGNELFGTCISATISGALYMLVRFANGGVNLYRQSLRGGRRRRLACYVEADAVLGVFDDVPVLACRTADGFEAWMPTWRRERVRIPTMDVLFQTSKAIWLRPCDQFGTCTATLIGCAGRAGLHLQTIDGATAWRHQHDALAMAETARRLPRWCQSLNLDNLPPSVAPCMKPAVYAEVRRNARFGAIDGRTGVSVWSSRSCYLLRDVWRPRCGWSPKTHALHSRRDRACVRTILLCAHRRLHARVLSALIERYMSA